MKDFNMKLGSLMLGLSLVATSLMAGEGKNSSSSTLSSTKTVDEAEIHDLQFMREEEKLARDVYIFAYSQWGTTVFDNISESEQEHTDKIVVLLEKYNLEDPALVAEGEFSDEHLQELYNDLIAAVQGSEIDALYVGTAIEEIDMIDILEAIERTDNRDIRTTYQNLLDGSKLHLKAFVNVLESRGITYEPRYIDKDFYDEIMDDE